MTAQEIIKLWNSKKGSHYKTGSSEGLSRELNQLENGCDCNFYLEFNGLYLRVVMMNDKYSISFQKEEYDRLQEELNAQNENEENESE